LIFDSLFQETKRNENLYDAYYECLLALSKKKQNLKLDKVTIPAQG
jgi:hypothetical protein